MPYRVGEPSADELIDDEHRLNDALERCGRVVGVDTEFIRTNTFFPIPAIYQIADDAGVGLVDAAKPFAFDAMIDFFESDRHCKIMHACSEDLEVIEHHLGIRPSNLVDTQLAHAFVAPEFSPSYARLVEDYLGVVLPKHATRSNWLKRPLSNEQIQYAQEDVLYLVPLWDAIAERLETLGRREWFEEEMEFHTASRETAPADYYKTMKRAWRMDARQLAILRSVTEWREQEARRRDVPRARTVWDEHLLALAQARQPDRAALERLLPRQIVKRYATELLEAVALGAADPEPPEPLPEPLTQREGEIVKMLRDEARECAEALGIAPELLARKRDVEACLRHFKETGELMDSYRGWRDPLVGARFREILSESLP